LTVLAPGDVVARHARKASGTVTAWDKLALRLQSAAYRGCKGHAYSEMSIKLIFVEGELYGWSDPKLGIDYVETPFDPERLADARVEIGNGQRAKGLDSEPGP